MFITAWKRHGVFFESIAVVVGSTVGAGVLAIPYAVAQVGIGIGLLYLIGLGVVMLTLHILLGEIVARTDGTLQLPGLARKYLGHGGGAIMSALFFFGIYSALLAYTIGQGEVLAALFGGAPFWWSIIFFAVGALVLYRGLRTVKVVELVMTIALAFVVIVLAVWATPEIALDNLAPVKDWTQLFLPYGVILFAYYGASAVVVAHTIVGKNQTMYKRALVISSVIPIVLYTLFTVVVVGVTGSATTEVATVGLGQVLGPAMLIFGNVFAFVAMGTSFLMLGTALSETYEWDYKLHPTAAWAATVAVPLVVFLVGVRSFVQVIGFAGSLFLSVETILFVLMYWRAQHVGDLPARRLHLRAAPLLSAVILIAFTIAGVYSMWEFFV